jgi:hypothetical protein
MSKISDLSKILKQFFNDKAEEISKSSNFIKRKRKLHAPSFLKALIIGNMSCPNHYSLDRIRQILYEDSIEISKQALDFRFTEDAVKFMKTMYEESFELFQNELRLGCKILEQFKSVKLLDSTYISLPDNMYEDYKGYGSSYPGRDVTTKSGIKLQLLFDYLNQNLSKIDIKAGARSDQGYRDYLANIESGDLFIGDLGYFVPESFKKIKEIGAYFISRYKADTNIYEIGTKHKLDLVEILRDKSFFTQEVDLGKDARLRVRLVCQKLSEEHSEFRRRKANKLAKSKGYTSSKNNQKLLDFQIFITNLPEEMINSDQVSRIYKSRWQIELLFKLYKSYVNIDKFKTSKPARLLCEFYAKLCFIAIFHGLLSCIEVNPRTEISLPKAILELQRRARELFFTVSMKVNKITNFLKKMFLSWEKFCIKDIGRKNRISTLTSIKLLTSFP